MYDNFSMIKNATNKVKGQIMDFEKKCKTHMESIPMENISRCPVNCGRNQIF